MVDTFTTFQDKPTDIEAFNADTWLEHKGMTKVFTATMPDGSVRTMSASSLADASGFLEHLGKIKNPGKKHAPEPLTFEDGSPMSPRIKPKKKKVAAPKEEDDDLDVEGLIDNMLEAEQRKMVRPQKAEVDYPMPLMNANLAPPKQPSFSAIKMPWLKEKPQDPTNLVKFSSEAGDFEAYYHAVVGTEAILYLIFDTRCKIGRFMPKMSKGKVDITIIGKVGGAVSYSGVLWAEGQVEIGVLALTPFIILPAEVEEVEEPVPPSLDEGRIPDYDWDMGRLDNSRLAAI